MTADDFYQRDAGQRNYWCPNVRDVAGGEENRDFTLTKWAAHLQNDFRARMDWCVKGFADANHPPIVVLSGTQRRAASAGEVMELHITQSSDPDGQPLSVDWMFYAEPSGYRGPAPAIENPRFTRTNVTVPRDAAGSDLHFVAIVTDNGRPPLTRYTRVVISVAE
jgi:hypothetical protein